MAESIDARQVEVRRRIANNLKLFRGKHGMSQEALADRAGLHRTQISAIERGKSNVMVDTLVALATVIGVDTVELLIARDEMPVRLKSGRKGKLHGPAIE